MIQYESFLFVEVPENATEFNVFERSFSENKSRKYLQCLRSGVWDTPYLIRSNHNWEIIGISYEVNENTVMQIIGQPDLLINDNEEYPYWKDYSDPEEQLIFYSAMQSYSSLLKAAGVTYNRFVILKKIPQ